jgi:uncharacterized repeat protein (TIGR03803 family)
MLRSTSLSCARYFSRVAVVVLTCLVSSVWAQKETILYNFEAFPRGATPMSNLIADATGNLYGTTFFGGRYRDWLGEDGSGTVFELSPTSNGKWTETVLYSFTGGSDGANPAAGLVLDSAGNLYGVTEYGGNYSCDSITGCGTIFELSPRAHGQWAESTLHIFTGGPNDGALPVGGLIFDNAGNLYGTTGVSGTGGGGTIFELSPRSNGNWTETILYNFTGSSDGGDPSASLIFDSAGNLYGTAYHGGDTNCGYYGNGCGVVFELSPNGNGTWTETVLHTFEYDDGAFSTGVLVSDSSGNLYSTAQAGPGSGCFSSACGIVFRLHHNPDGSWTYSIIHTFEGGLDGAYPVAGVVMSNSGRIYGTTQQGGGGSCYPSPCGIAFELTPHSADRWTEKVIHNFAAGNDGSEPVASLMFDQRGNLYGTASAGGSLGGGCPELYQPAGTYRGCGSVFKLTPASGGLWKSKALYTFPPAHTGFYPDSGLISDDSGNLYGVTGTGGTNNCFVNGCGTVFELAPKTGGGWRMVVLHNFNGSGDGQGPVGPLIADKLGNLYGTTSTGGSTRCLDGSYCGGTVFELSPMAQGWKETLLHTFRTTSSGQQGDGGVPEAGLIMDSEGNLYGATEWGGDLSNPNCTRYGCGTVFKLSRTSGDRWREDVLYRFQGGGDGVGPAGTLLFDDQGTLYGTTAYGGTYDCGTVFKLTPGSGGKWAKSVLYSFRGSQHSDGATPFAGLIADEKGNLFGTTRSGGTGNSCNGDPCGTVFELSPKGSGSWKEIVLLDFQGTDGSMPQSTLVLDEVGNLYGAAPYGTGTCCAAGTVFELSPGSNGWTEHVLHHFGTGNDGAGPNGPLLFDQAGNIFGTTFAGGKGAVGTIFKLSPGGLTEEWTLSSQ